MLKQIETSHAIAETVSRCRPDVICAYPITPQTHIVEALADLSARSALGRAAFTNVESELAALSFAIGAAAAGGRPYTATSSQGLLFMTEALYNAAGLGMPIVLTLGTRAIGAPINIWNDHSDAMALRDAGWIQLFASSSQDAADLHVLAFRLAEELSVPVMVCVDGFVLTHSVEAIDVPEQAVVDAFLPPRSSRHVLDPARPITIGPLVGPDAFTEVKYAADVAMRAAIDRYATLSADLSTRLGRAAGGLVRGYRLEGADTAVVALGSLNGTIADLVDALRADGVPAGALDIGMFRPFPRAAVAAALRDVRRVVVVEKNVVLGAEGVLASDLRLALGSLVAVDAVIAGLGGRPVTAASLRPAIEAARAGTLEPRAWLDRKVAS